jgi:hypothetical protein
MLHAARLSSQDASECCLTAQRQSMLACGHSAQAAADAGFQKS